ncbi:MAG: type I-A CRISPR-associated protein Cas5a, partial [Candidatus Bathyarchaeia archaeon]
SEVRGFSDAMVREFVLTYPRSLLIIPRSEDAINDLIRALWLINRFGNSESYISVFNVKLLRIDQCDSKEVNVMIKYLPNLIIGGSYTVTKALDENGEVFMMAMPVSSSQRGDIYYPSRIKVSRNTLCVNNNGKYIVFPAGDDW